MTRSCRRTFRNAFDSARKAYCRMNGKGDDQGGHRRQEDSEGAQGGGSSSLKEAADQLRGKKKKKKRRFGRLLLLAIVGGALALVLSEGLRKKVLDALFGAEEEFEYTASTTPEPAASPSSNEPVGTS